ncbi:glucan endo-1,3-beta-glucosidase 14 isoform X2 [Lathyrus oleraceus]|uniref:glucan endo-1,3-beta-glucosidase 14 isoform X2 n=1 Tax=Pisum sativum TaxID=3888 RepID=UPI0021D27C9F|nr:glucan endo-1,3-beta-glucosidase 14-like isoform X2 [Pisum sativum]
MTSFSFFKSLFFFLLIISDSFMQINCLSCGINYGQIANNLPSPSRVSVLIRSMNVTNIKLYDANPNVLLAFSQSNVEFVIGLGNENLQNMTNPSKAQNWIQQHVLPYLSQTKITCINVGNEVLNSNNTQMMLNLLPSMRNVHTALVNLGDNPNEVPLNYALFQPNQGLVDPNTNLHYDNMLYAQMDAVYAAIKVLGFTNIEVRVSETGWPSKGDSDEIGATIQNAKLYNGNLLRRIEEKQGTPGKPLVPIDVYVFALFNEDLKNGPASERNYGLYYPNGSPVYNIGLQGYLPQMALPSKSNVLSFNFVVWIVVTYLIFAWEL